MILYNVTVNIDFDVEEEWRTWMKDVHIPDVMSTGLFSQNKFYKLLGEVPEANGATYSIQYFAQNITDVNNYLENHAPKLIQEHMAKYKNKHVSFRTLLQEVIEE